MKLSKHVRVSDLHGASRLAIDATRGITDLAEALHAKIAAPFGMADRARTDRTAGITGFVYKSVRGVTGLVGGGIDAALSLLARADGSDTSSFERDAAISALNGVLGDYLVETNNALAIPFTLRHDGVALDLSSNAPLPIAGASSKIVLLIHGLCMNDRQWLRNGHDHGRALANELGFTPIYVRYNTGLHTSTNGASLAAALEQLVARWPHKVEDLVIVAHSMGGLVTRAAMIEGSYASHQWRKQLSKAIFLGTPHHGAPLERGGHWIDVVLGATPYSRPFARIGKVRSAGITDLRHGNVIESDWDAKPADRKTIALPDDVACYALAATTGKRKQDLRDAVLGDGLVPVASALGKHRLTKRRLGFHSQNTCVIYERNHMDLLSEPNVFGQIKSWLE